MSLTDNERDGETEGAGEGGGGDVKNSFSRCEREIQRILSNAHSNTNKLSHQQWHYLFPFGFIHLNWFVAINNWHIIDFDFDYRCNLYRKWAKESSKINKRGAQTKTGTRNAQECERDTGTCTERRFNKTSNAHTLPYRSWIHMKLSLRKIQPKINRAYSLLF